MLENEAQPKIIAAANLRGARLWRNNVGVLQDSRGQYVRFGLANTSKKLNDEIKSSDLIGCIPVAIEPHHVGQVIGQFVSIECKRPDWRWGGSDREKAQLRWLNLVRGMGGFAQFCRTEEDLLL